MNIRQLQVFQAVCEAQSFTLAAQKLYMTQPAVSHVIRDLEQEIGTPLFDRISRRVYLTGAGKAFLEKTDQLLELFSSLSHFSASEPPVRIGSSITIANIHLPAILKSFGQKNAARISVEVDSARHIKERLLENKIDLALIEGVVSHRRLVALPFSSFEISIVCAPGYPIGASVDLAAFVHETLLLREPGSAIRDTLDSALLLHDLCAEPAWTSVNSQALIQAAKSGLGLSVLPTVLVRRELETGALKELRVDGLRLRNRNYVVYRRDKYLTPSMRTLIELVQRS